jgi:hypothetical protein
VFFFGGGGLFILFFFVLILTDRGNAVSFLYNKILISTVFTRIGDMPPNPDSAF